MLRKTEIPNKMNENMTYAITTKKIHYRGHFHLIKTFLF